MAIYCELGTGQRLYLDNPGDRTIVTLATSAAGQQQQSSTDFLTGSWTAEPRIYQTANGIIVTLITATGNNFLEIRGSSARLLRETPTLIGATEMPTSSIEGNPAGFSMPPMSPMQPMQPLQMGDMKMSFQPMEMRMGNMAMSMGDPIPEKPRFCSQCGAKVAESDRFCSRCGHRLA